LWVTDASGQVVFESGSAREDGAIVGNDNDADATAFEPHYSLVDQEDQVQIYEAILVDTEDQVTTTLLRAAGYLKDNRLLPTGFAKSGQLADIAVYGAALEDEDFAASGDKIRYQIEVANAQGPFTVHAQLLYQAIGFRWAQNLGAQPAGETAFFLDAYAAVSNAPLVVADTSRQVP
jgi:hypothetical protein